VPVPSVQPRAEGAACGGGHGPTADRANEQTQPRQAAQPAPRAQESQAPIESYPGQAAADNRANAKNQDVIQGMVQGNIQGMTQGVIQGQLQGAIQGGIQGGIAGGITDSPGQSGAGPRSCQPPSPSLPSFPAGLSPGHG
jgi:hypothetical protein